MSLRKLLFSNIVFLLSIAPQFAGAQYSFQCVIKGQGDDEPGMLLETSEGNFILTGSSGSSGTTPDGNYIACFNSQGKLLWQKFGFKNHYGAENGLASIVETDSHNFFIGGGCALWSTDGNAAVLKMDNSGKILWDSVYPAPQGGGGSVLKVIAEPSSQTLVSIGPGASNADSVCWLFQKVNYHGQRTLYRYIKETYQLGLKDFYKNFDQSGYTLFCFDRVDIYEYAYIIKIDNYGNTISKRFIGQNPISTVIQNDNGTYTLLRKAGSKQYLVNYSSVGDSLSYLPLTSDAGLILCDKNNGCILLGNEVQFLDSNFHVTSTLSFIGSAIDNTGLTMMARSKDGGFYGCGTYFGGNRTVLDANDYFVFKVAPDGSITDNVTYLDLPITGLGNIDALSNKVKVYPNPTHDNVSIEGINSIESIKIYDAIGKLVYEISNSGNTVDVSHLSIGIYSLRIKSQQNQVVIKKIAIQ